MKSCTKAKAMRKNWNSAKTFVGSGTRIIGVHKACGGNVKYTATASMGFSWCDKCKASSTKGDCIVTARAPTPIAPVTYPRNPWD